MRRFGWLIAFVALALGSAAPAQTVGGGVAPPCDRACMTALVDRYLEALVAHDVEKGLVFSFPMFQHRGGTGSIRIYNVPGVDSLPLGGGASNLQAGEIFKIEGGRITAVEAMGASLPYGTQSGWGE